MGPGSISRGSSVVGGCSGYHRSPPFAVTRPGEAGSVRPRCSFALAGSGADMLSRNLSMSLDSSLSCPSLATFGQRILSLQCKLIFMRQSLIPKFFPLTFPCTRAIITPNLIPLLLYGEDTPPASTAQRGGAPGFAGCAVSAASGPAGGIPPPGDIVSPCAPVTRRDGRARYRPQ